MSAATTESLLRTPLHALHLELGARMVPFAGHAMPVQFPAGIMAEHLACRAGAALFDVSHMGQAELRGEGVGVKMPAATVAARSKDLLVGVDAQKMTRVSVYDGQVEVEDAWLGITLYSPDILLHLWTLQGAMRLQCVYNEAYFGEESVAALLRATQDELLQGLGLLG